MFEAPLLGAERTRDILAELRNGGKFVQMMKDLAK